MTNADAALEGSCRVALRIHTLQPNFDVQALRLRQHCAGAVHSIGSQSTPKPQMYT